MHGNAWTLAFLLFGACADQDSPELVYVEAPASHFESYIDFARIAPDGGAALLWSFRGTRLVDLQTGRQDSVRFRGPHAATFDARFLPDGRLLRLAAGAEGPGWWLETPDGPALTAIPPSAWPEVGPRAERIAFLTFRPGELIADPQISFLAGAPDSVVSRPLPGRPNGSAWFPDGERVAVILLDDSYRSSLWEVPLQGEPRRIAAALDVQYLLPRLSVSTDGSRILVAMATERAPKPEERHVPYADRDLDIYAVSVATGAVTRVTGGPADDFGPNAVADALYWMTNATTQQVAVVPIEGGDIRVVFDEAGIPAWHPDGDRLGFVYGQWRLVDWALNLDGASIPWREDRENQGEARVLVEGYHEDFGPVWSPDGRWIAYHSHRSHEPLGHYFAEGAADDIYLKAADGTGEEIRLTDFGLEAGGPDWAPTGDAIVFTSWERLEPLGTRASAYVVEIDPATGSVRDTYRLPLPDSLNVRYVAWSPAPSELAIEARLPDGTEGLFIFDRVRGTLDRIATYTVTTYGGVDWTPDGSKLVYTAIEDGRLELRIIGRTGESVRTIRDPSADLIHPQISPNGRHIAVTRMRHRKELWRMRLP